MGATTITYYKCDGDGCGKVLSDPNAGIVLHGYITAVGEVDNNKGLLAGSNRNTFGHPPSTAYCWKCFHALVPDPTIAEIRREVAAIRSDLAEARKEASGASSRDSYHDSYRDNDDYDPYPRMGNKGPTGPLAPPEVPSEVPPEMPHYAAVAANIAGVHRG